MHLTIIHTQCLQCLPSKTVAVWEATCCGWNMLEVWWTRYSLRMLEGRLRKDCPTAKDTDVQEAHLLRTSCIPVLLRGFQWFQVPRLWHRCITEACRSVMIIVNFYVEDCGGAHSPQHNRLWICFRTFKAIYIAIRVVTWVSLMHLCKYNYSINLILYLSIYLVIVCIIYMHMHTYAICMIAWTYRWQ